MEKNKILSAFLGLSKTVKAVISLAVLLAVSAIVIGICLQGKPRDISIDAEASLRKILETSELSTVEYTYNAVATKYNDDNTKALYHVAYKGKVKAGIDFSKVLYNIDKNNKLSFLTLPEAEIQGTYVDVAEMDYIFVKDKYETETVSKEAYSLCTADLERSANEQESLLVLARENARSTLEALLNPWLESLDDEYQIVFSGEEEK